MDTSAVYTVHMHELCRLKRGGDFRNTTHSDLYSFYLSFPLVVLTTCRQRARQQLKLCSVHCCFLLNAKILITECLCWAANADPIPHLCFACYWKVKCCTCAFATSWLVPMASSKTHTVVPSWAKPGCPDASVCTGHHHLGLMIPIHYLVVFISQSGPTQNSDYIW